MGSEEFTLLDSEEYLGGKQGEGFSYAALVMMCYRKALDNGSEEMREGYWNTKFDRLGNAHKVWVADARKTFIESVKTLRMLLEREFDEKAEEELKDIDEELKNTYKLFCDLDKREWENMPYPKRNELEKKGEKFRAGMLSQALPYAYEYLLEQVKMYRKIMVTLGKLIKRKDDFGEVYIEA